MSLTNDVGIAQTESAFVHIGQHVDLAWEEEAEPIGVDGIARSHNGILIPDVRCGLV
jgi:hypothetical protein